MTVINAYFIGNILAVLILGTVWGCGAVLAVRAVRGYLRRTK